MTRDHRRSLIITWSMLLLATFIAWGLGARLPLASPRAHTLIALAILTIVIIKCRLVIRDFMDVKTAPRWLQRSCDSWLLLNYGMILAYALLD